MKKLIKVLVCITLNVMKKELVKIHQFSEKNDKNK